MQTRVGKAIDVIKKGGKRPTEDFNRDKLHASVYLACLSVKTPDGEADDIARRVCDAIVVWIDDKPEVTSKDIHVKAHEHLHDLRPAAAHMYKSHKVVL